MRRIVLLFAATAAVSLSFATPAAAGGADPCDLLSKKQARTIMGVKPFGSPRPDNGGCSWETDPSSAKATNTCSWK